MKGSAAVLILSIIIAAVIGIGAAFAMQTMLPETTEKSVASDSPAQFVDPLRNELAQIEHRISGRIDELGIAFETMNVRISELQKEVRSMSVPAVAIAPDGTPAAPVGQMDSVINRVLDDRAKRDEDERQAEREQRANEMREHMKTRMTERLDSHAQEKNWAPQTTTQVKQILNGAMEKMNELGIGMMGGRGGRRGGGFNRESMDQMRQIIDDTRTQLLGVVSEEEVSDLLRSAGLGFGGGGRTGGRDNRQPGGGQPGGGGR